MNESLAGKVVIVTGASSGVGEAAARAFAKQGAVVVLAARSADKLSALAKAIGGIAVPTDVSQLGDLRNLVETTVARCGRIDIVVNNAAANARGALDTLEPDAIASVIDANLKAPLLLTRLALPHLRQSRGVVVNVASIAGHVPLPYEAPYCASKWGLRGFTFAVREELREAGVAVCVVSPGPISTPFVLDDLDHVPDLVFSQPILTAEQVADAIVACAIDRKRERALPRSTLVLAKLAATFPWMQEWLRPSLEAKGARVKAMLKLKGAGRK
ncbi:MAG: SDR family oxidoreductase [Steroidobacteraceae bacterium]|nr:SDR family oxidoreductase [Pseudomonadota bacterium]MBP7608234.1 SDR family oxidoreductase [Steroidobacteraceae bacterium]MBP9129269.1 SDR family oxidoreductase [Steroidobacteraceae bacterium]